MKNLLIFLLIILIIAKLWYYINNEVKSERLTKQVKDITVITCYYKISSKRHSSEYEQWISDFLSLPTAMVIFTDEISAPQIIYIRTKQFDYSTLTQIIIRPLNQVSLYLFL